MKTTSYEISKKLAEIGFTSQTDKFYDSGQGRLLDEINVEDETGDIIAAYDLETLLDNLPYYITKDRQDYFLIVNQHVIAYEEDCREKPDLEGCVRENLESESLADTAARLLLLLHEKGILNFKK